MLKQSTNTILMVEPVAFRFNAETAQNNYFQQTTNMDNSESQLIALKEFENMVSVLRKYDINVIVVRDTPEPSTPDSIFPNNWISFHEPGQSILYPLYAQNRRLERRFDIFDLVGKHGFFVENVDDFSFWETEGKYLEGTGSMVLDRVNAIAYACISERTDLQLFETFCFTFGYEPVSFHAFHKVHDNFQPIYHTNVMMSVASDYVVICIDSILNDDEKHVVLNFIQQTKKECIEISEKQVNNFAGNMLQVVNNSGKPYLVMSENAYNSLNEFQISRLKKYNDFIIIPISFIEAVGGGSVRCMMAEVF